MSPLHEPQENRLLNRRIGSRLHRVYTYEFSKRGLCAFDDKRHICENGIDTLAHGHKSLRQPELEDLEEEEEEEVQVVRRGSDDEEYVSFEHAMREPRLRPDPELENVGGLDPDQAFAELRRTRLVEMFGNVDDGDEEDQVPVGDMLGLLSFVF